MIKRVFCLFAALMILWMCTASAEQVTVTGEPVQYVSEAEESRAIADEMEQRFGVTILLGDECLNVLHLNSFSIGNQAPARSLLHNMLGINDTVNELKKLENALSQYPVELFQYIKDDNAPNGLRFFIVDQIVENNPDMNSVGYTTCEGGFYNIVLGYRFFETGTVHHEIWHAMERFITARYPGAFLIWDSLNPPGFQYCNDFTRTDYEYDPDYFVRDYGTVNAAEDRATVAEAVFYENRNEWFAEYPAIKRKLDAMNLALKDTLTIQYNVKVD